MTHSVQFRNFTSSGSMVGRSSTDCRAAAPMDALDKAHDSAESHPCLE